MLAQDFSINVDRRPYLLNPDKPTEGEARRIADGETETDLNEAMQERARGVGLVMRRPRWSPNTMLVHEATRFAKEVGADGRFHHTAAAAYWEIGADLGSIEVIQDLAEGSGLDWSVLGPRLESGQYRDQVLQEYQAARDRGVKGTPTYSIGGELHGGDISLDELREAIQGSA